MCVYPSTLVIGRHTSWEARASTNLLFFIQVTSACVRARSTVLVSFLVCRNPRSLHPIFETGFFHISYPHTHTRMDARTQKSLCRCAECVVINREPVKLISTTSLWCRERDWRQERHGDPKWKHNWELLSFSFSLPPSGAAVPPMRQESVAYTLTHTHTHTHTHTRIRTEREWEREREKERLPWWSRDKNSVTALKYGYALKI